MQVEAEPACVTEIMGNTGAAGLRMVSGLSSHSHWLDFDGDDGRPWGGCLDDGLRGPAGLLCQAQLMEYSPFPKEESP